MSAGRLLDDSAKNGTAFDRSERAAVTTVPAIVAHHEKLVRREAPHLVFGFFVRERKQFLRKIRFPVELLVDVNFAAFDVNGLVRGGDDAFDIKTMAAWVFQGHNIARLWIVKQIG